MFFSSRRRHTRLQGDWSSDVCSSDLAAFETQYASTPGNARNPVTLETLTMFPRRSMRLGNAFCINWNAARTFTFRSEERRVGKEWKSMCPQKAAIKDGN